VVVIPHDKALIGYVAAASAAAAVTVNVELSENVRGDDARRTRE